MKTAGAVLIENSQAWLMSMTQDKHGRLSQKQPFCVDAKVLLSARPQNKKLKNVLNSTLTLAVGTDCFYYTIPEFSFTDTTAVIQSARYKAEPVVPESIENLKCACLHPAGSKAAVLCLPANDFKDIQAAKDLRFAPWLTAAVDGLIYTKQTTDSFNFIALQQNKTTLVAVRNRNITEIESFVPSKEQEERINSFLLQNPVQTFVSGKQETLPTLPETVKLAPALHELILLGLCLYGLGQEKIKFTWCDNTLPLSRQIYSGAKTSAALIIMGSLFCLALSFNINRNTKQTKTRTQKQLTRIFQNVCGTKARMIDPERQINITLENQSGSLRETNCRLYARTLEKLNRALAKCEGIDTQHISINERSIKIEATAKTMQKSEQLRSRLTQDFKECRIDRIETQNSQVSFSVSAQI